MTTTTAALPAAPSTPTRTVKDKAARRPAANGMVPLTERVRHMQLVRAAAGATAVGVAATPALGPSDLRGIAVSTACYLALVGIAQLFFSSERRRRLPVFGGLFLADGLYLAWVTWLSGGVASELRFLLPLYALAATLLASYRTGLKVTIWMTLTVYAAYRAAEAGILPGAAGPSAAAGWLDLIVLVALLWTVALGAAIFSSVNERELRRRRHDLQAMARLSRRLETEVEPEAIGQATLEALANTCAVRRGAIIIQDPAGCIVLATLEAPAVVGRVPIDTPLLERVALSRDPVLLRRLDPTDAPLPAILLPDARNVVVLPLYDETHPIGALLVERGNANRGRLEQRVLGVMQQFAAQASLALRRAWLIDELRRQAESDGLTGLANRRTFDSVIVRELERATRRSDPVGLLLIDIDHFKRLNDTHGHQAGDAVLRELAAKLRELARPFDTVARYGGEEFAVILPDCPEEGAMIVAERIRMSVDGGAFSVPITVSIGVAGESAGGRDAQALIRAADAALYAAKRAGRNRVASTTQPEFTMASLPSHLAARRRTPRGRPLREHHRGKVPA